MKITTAVSIVMLCSSLFRFAGAEAARADTPQLAVGRMTTAYNHLDLTNYMAVHTANFMVTNVSGKHQAYLPLQATIARQFTSRTHTFLQSKLVGLTVQGNAARSKLIEHYVQHQTSQAPQYAAIRDVTADVLWVNGPRGWQMTSEQMLRDVNIYQRL